MLQRGLMKPQCPLTDFFHNEIHSLHYALPIAGPFVPRDQVRNALVFPQYASDV